MNNKISGQG